MYSTPTDLTASSILDHRWVQSPLDSPGAIVSIVYDNPRFSAVMSINSLTRVTTELRAALDMLRMSTPSLQHQE